MESTFSSRLVALRAARQLTQQELANAAGVSRSRIAVIETTVGRLPHALTIARLAEALGVLPAHLLGEVSARPAPAVAPAPEVPVACELIDKLLTQINDTANLHREELAALRKEHKTAMGVHIRMMNLTTNVLNEKIHYMEGRLGLRPLTVAELAAQQALEAPRAPKIGLKHYETSPIGGIR